MDRERIDALLRQSGYVSDELKAEVEAKVDETLEKIRGFGFAVGKPEILYDLKGRTAGQAINGRVIRINGQILNNPKYKEDMLHNTIPHEVAHIAIRQNYPQAKGHGGEWQFLMIRLGLKPERCHQYETTAARKKSKPYTVYCDCEPHQVTVTIYRRMQEGRRYKCKRCNAELRFS